MLRRRLLRQRLLLVAWGDGRPDHPPSFPRFRGVRRPGILGGRTTST